METFEELNITEVTLVPSNDVPLNLRPELCETCIEGDGTDTPPTTVRVDTYEDSSRIYTGYCDTHKPNL